MTKQTLKRGLYVERAIMINGSIQEDITPKYTKRKGRNKQQCRRISGLHTPNITGQTTETEN